QFPKHIFIIKGRDLEVTAFLLPSHSIIDYLKHFKSNICGEYIRDDNTTVCKDKCVLHGITPKIIAARSIKI
ncbi:hypothetical protein, partial [Lactiplantibacillus plantarum]|uniref:hypothetical protein n=1 Tax=Lactiplantibacillus plantarum TaxID=1590 RepID=UPI00240E237A